MKEEARIGKGWHLDQRVTLSVLGVIVMQSIALGWWGASLNARVHQIEAAIAKQDARFDTLAANGTQIAVLAANISTLNEKVSSLQQDVRQDRR